jgi:hypothetical protein
MGVVPFSAYFVFLLGTASRIIAKTPPRRQKYATRNG